MRKYVLFVFLLIRFISLKAQNDTFPTIGEVFNFEVGDTFEYKYQMYCGGGIPPYPIEYTRYVVLDKYLLSSTFYYDMQTRTCRKGYHYVQGNFVLYNYCDPVLDTIPVSYTNVDSLIFKQLNYHSFEDQDSTGHKDSVFISNEYPGVKVVTHQTPPNSSSAQFLEWGVGIGWLSESYATTETGGDNYCNDLIYFHKANGQQWGALYVLPVGVADLQVDFVITVFPNPVNDQFQITTEHPATFSLYNALGQQVLSQKVDKFATINRNGLPAGIYYWVAENEGIKAGSGKLIFK